MEYTRYVSIAVAFISSSLMCFDYEHQRVIKRAREYMRRRPRSISVPALRYPKATTVKTVPVKARRLIIDSPRGETKTVMPIIECKE